MSSLQTCSVTGKSPRCPARRLLAERGAEPGNDAAPDSGRELIARLVSTQAGSGQRAAGSAGAAGLTVLRTDVNETNRAETFGREMWVRVERR
jgi:hypothetical protein